MAQRRGGFADDDLDALLGEADSLLADDDDLTSALAEADALLEAPELPTPSAPSARRLPPAAAPAAQPTLSRPAASAVPRGGVPASRAAQDLTVARGGRPTLPGGASGTDLEVIASSPASRSLIPPDPYRRPPQPRAPQEAPSLMERLVDLPARVAGAPAQAAKGFASGVVGAAANVAGTLAAGAFAKDADEAKRLAAPAQFARQFLGPDASLQPDILDDPGVMLDPQWWGYMSGQLAGSVTALAGTGGAGQAVGKAAAGRLLTMPAVAAKLAQWGGPAAATAGEAFLEASDTYTSLVAEGQNPQAAAEAAERVFSGNIALLGLTNHPLFEAGGGTFRKMITRAASEGAQEAGQQAMSNVAQGKPVEEGLGTATLLGAVGGPVAGAGIDALQSQGAPSSATPAPAGTPIAPVPVPAPVDLRTRLEEAIAASQAARRASSFGATPAAADVPSVDATVRSNVAASQAARAASGFAGSPAAVDLADAVAEADAVLGEAERPADAPPAPSGDSWDGIPDAVRSVIESHVGRIAEAARMVAENDRLKGPAHGDLELQSQRSKIEAAIGRLEDFRALARKNGLAVGHIIDGPLQQARDLLSRAAPPVVDNTRPAVDTAPPPAQTVVDVPEGGPGSGEGADAPGRAPRNRVADVSQARRISGQRRDAHYAAVFDAILADARDVDPEVDPSEVRREFDARIEFFEDQQRDVREAGGDPRDLLREIARLGGLDELEGGQQGELRRLREGQGGAVAGVKGVFRRRRYDARGVPSAGIPLDVMLQKLQQDPRWNFIEDLDDLVGFIEDVQKGGAVDYDVLPGTDRVARELGMRPGEAWWKDRWFEPPADSDAAENAAFANDATVAGDEGDLSFDAADLEGAIAEADAVLAEDDAPAPEAPPAPAPTNSGGLRTSKGRPLPPGTRLGTEAATGERVFVLPVGPDGKHRIVDLDGSYSESMSPKMLANEQVGVRLDPVDADTLDTGEQQTRLPGEVGAVRDEERAQPTEDVPEQTLVLTSQDAKTQAPLDFASLVSEADDVLDADLEDARRATELREYWRTPKGKEHIEAFARKAFDKPERFYAWFMSQDDETLVRAWNDGYAVVRDAYYEFLAELEQAEPGPAPMSAAEREDIIARVVQAAQEPAMPVVEIAQFKGSDGKWYRPQGVPWGVRLSDERRVEGYAFLTKDGTTVGPKHFATREAAEQWQRDNQAERDDDLRQALRERDDDGLRSAADYWLNPKPVAAPAAPKKRRPAKKKRTLRDRLDAMPRREAAGDDELQEINPKNPSILAMPSGAASQVQPARASKPTPKGKGRNQGLTLTQQPQPGTKTLAETPKNARPSDIVRDMAKLFEVPVGVGRLITHRALGYFYPRIREIRVRVANGLPVLMHEFGHASKRHFALSLRDKRWAGELLVLGAPTSMPSYTVGQRLEEGRAEFWRLWVLEPGRAQQMAPQFHKAIERRLDEMGDLGKSLRDLQRRAQAFLAADPVARVNLRIDFDGKGTQPVGEWVDRAAKHWVDDLHRLGQAVAAMAGGAPLDPARNAYLLARTARGSAARASDFLETGVRGLDGQFIGPSLRAALQPVSDKLGEFAVYLVALRAKELHGRNMETGMTNAEVDGTIRAIETGPDAQRFAKARDGVYEFQSAMLNYARANGLISTDQQKAIQRVNQFYVPFQRVLDDGATPGPGTGRRIADRLAPIKRIKGSGRDIINPLESIIKNAFAMVDAVEKNRAMQALANLVDTADDERRPGTGAGRWLRRINDPQQMTGVKLADVLLEASQKAGATFMNQRGQQVLHPDLEDLLNDLGIDPNQIVPIFQTAFSGPKGEQIVTVVRNGKRQFYQVADPMLYDALTQIAPIQKDRGELADVAETMAKLLRAGATLTVGFIARNPGRDTLSAFLQSRHGFIPVYDTVRGLVKTVLHDLGVRHDEEVAQFWAQGVTQATLSGMDRRALRAKVRSLADPVAHRRSVVLNPLELLQAVSAYSEVATRMGEFSLALRQKGEAHTLWQRLRAQHRTATIDESTLAAATLAARDVTTDFSRAGSIAREANRYAAFFNARIQGYVRIAETIRRDPGAVAINAGMLAAVAVFLRLLADDDDDYKQLAEWEKLTYWHWRPTWGNDQADTFIRIPKPFEWAFIPNAVEAAVVYAKDRDPEAFKLLKAQAKDSARTFLTGFLPTAIVPALEASTNYSLFRQSPIVSPWDLDLPLEQQAGDWTSQTARALTRAGVPLAPAKIDHLLYGHFAGLGRAAVSSVVDPALRLAGVAPPKATEPERRWEDVPGIGALVRSSAPRSDAESIREFYEAFREMTGHERGFRRAKDDSAQQQRILDSVKRQRWRGREAEMKAAKKKIDAIADEIDAVYSNAEMTPRQKTINLEGMRRALVYEARVGLGYESTDHIRRRPSR